ncbi:unnamed protein product [Lota lota]
MKARDPNHIHCLKISTQDGRDEGTETVVKARVLPGCAARVLRRVLLRRRCARLGCAVGSLAPGGGAELGRVARAQAPLAGEEISSEKLKHKKIAE